jgi:pimeloyl-ACP methyl ester carboxylesterase
MKKKDLALIVGGGVGFAIAYKFVTRPSKIRFEEVSHLIPYSDRSDFIEIDDIRIHYQEFGPKTGKTLILIHGYSASTVSWDAILEPLADEGFRVIALDMVGFGFSEKPSWFEYTINAQARIVERFMDRMGIGRAVVAGNSYGGAVAATLALDYPERVEKLVMVASVIDNEPQQHPLMVLAAMPGVGELAMPFLIDSKAFLRRRLRELLGPNAHLATDVRVGHYHRPLRSAETQNAMLSTSRNWDAERITEDAPLITQPTLLIWGDSDPVIPVRMGEKMYDSILHSRLVVFKNCGHLPQQEYPGLFVDVVTDFCDDPKGDIGQPKEEAVNFGV